MNVVAIVGPTAAGKSAIAEAVAEAYGAVVVSVDSMQLYRGMDVGTAKPDAATRRRVDYRMLDVCDPSEELSVQRFQELARGHVREVLGQGGRVVIAGGSGLHFRSIVDPMTFAPTDPELKGRLERSGVAELRSELLAADPGAGDVLDLANPRRVVRAVEVLRLTGTTPTERSSTTEADALRRYEPVIPFVGFGIDPGDAIVGRVVTRLERMLEDGLVAEVERLMGRLGRTASQAVAYRQYAAALRGEMSLDEAFDETVRVTNALVKRQRTFFRRDPRIEWLPWSSDERYRVAAAVDEIGEAAQWTS